MVVSYEELVPRFYKTVRSLSTILRRSEKRGYGLRRISRGHNSGRALIEYDSLPAEIRDALEDPRKERHPIDMFYKRNREAEQFYATHMLEDGRRISPELQQRYSVNAATIEAVMALRTERERLFARCGKKVKKEWETLSADLKSFKEVQEQRQGMVHTLPENPRRLQETVMRYANAEDKKSAYVTLISGKHTSKTARKVDDRMQDLFESLFAGIGYKPNYYDVYTVYTDFLRHRTEVISNATGEVLQPEEFKEVSESTIRNYLARWESRAGTLRLRTGDRQKLIGETKPYHTMETPRYAGSIISVDDRQPPFEYAKGERVWFYLAYDLGADCYTTMVWGKDKQGIILDFYRQMVRNYAEWGLPLPAEIECESNLNASYKETFLAEGAMFRYVRIEANNARGKKIENRNRAMRYGEERKSEGWIARPFAGSESNRAGAEKVTMLPYDTIVEQTLERYEQWNNEPHPRHPEMSRWEFFLTQQNPELQPINWLGIIPHLGYITRSSCRTGIVKLNHGECLLGEDGRIATGDKLISLMKLAEGEELEVRWLDDNQGRVLKAYAYIGGQYICELLPKPTYSRARIEQTEADREARELMSKYVATVEGYGNRRKKSIERVTVIASEHATEREPAKRYSTIPQLSAIKRERHCRQDEEVEILPETEEFDPTAVSISRAVPRKRFADTF